MSDLCTPSAAAALYTASDLALASLKTAYLVAMRRVYDLRFRGPRFWTVLNYMADVRDLGHVPSVMAALAAADAILAAEAEGKFHSLWDLTAARQEAIKACRRSA